MFAPTDRLELEVWILYMDVLHTGLRKSIVRRRQPFAATFTAYDLQDCLMYPVVGRIENIFLSLHQNAPSWSHLRRDLYGPHTFKPENMP